ncbi:hypothetical protein XA67_16100 [Comamonas thiooxydans]|jgi:hypothetical protein|nr:hypothetical protein XA67_16100 [Comamonas thiooxydans]
MWQQIWGTLELVAQDMPGGVPVLHAFLLVGCIALLMLVIEVTLKVIVAREDSQSPKLRRH